MRSQHHAVYVISVAAELAGMHPQTLRIYERRGLVQPARTQGGNRRYSDVDIECLRRISELTKAGIEPGIFIAVAAGGDQRVVVVRVLAARRRRAGRIDAGRRAERER